MADARSPLVQAGIIVDRAELDQLVESVDEHHLIDCSAPEDCPGEAVTHVVVNEMRGGEVRRLLLLAVAELAVRRRG